MIIGKKLYREHTIDDSMAWARKNIETAPDGSVFLADVLTKARGRQGRTWQVMAGQLMVTFILKPTLFQSLHQDDCTVRINQLNMAVCLGILEPLKSFGVRLKWPNDFVLNGKKLGGMLTHVVWSEEKLIGMIVGFALNINNEFLPDDPLIEIATSLKTEKHQAHELRPLYKDVLQGLNTWYMHWQHEEFMNIYKNWRLMQAFLGKEIQLHQKDGSIMRGLAQQVLPNGDLLLIDESKKQHLISFFQVEEVKIPNPSMS